MALTDANGTEVFGGTLYDSAAAAGAPPAAVDASLGCGVPTAVADLHPGEWVLDLGSGAGTDVLISARRVAPDGMAIGLDMTDEMLELAVRNAVEAGVTNVEFRKGFIEEIPLEDASVDVVISNCVINLSADKAKVLSEAARVLRPGGRFAVSDVIADPGMDAATRADMEQWTGCIAGALTAEEFERRAHGCRLHGRGDRRDPPRARARELRDRAGAQAHALIDATPGDAGAYRLLLALGALDAAGYSVIVPVTPAIADATGAGPATIGLLVASFPAAMVAGFWLAGRALERHGVRPLLRLRHCSSSRSARSASRSRNRCRPTSPHGS